MFLTTVRLKEGWRDHLKVSVCWKHQVMTFITNDLGPPAMIRREACCFLQAYKIKEVFVLMERVMTL